MLNAESQGGVDFKKTRFLMEGRKIKTEKLDFSLHIYNIQIFNKLFKRWLQSIGLETDGGKTYSRSFTPCLSHSENRQSSAPHWNTDPMATYCQGRKLKHRRQLGWGVGVGGEE